MDADSTYPGAPLETRIKVGAQSRSAGKFAAVTAGHRQRQGGELGLLQGSGTLAVSMGTDAEWHRIMPAHSSGRLDGESRKENSKRMFVGIRGWCREQSFEHRWR